MTQKRLFEIFSTQLPEVLDASFRDGGAFAVGEVIQEIREALDAGHGEGRIEAALEAALGAKSHTKRLKHIVAISGRFKDVRALKTFTKSNVDINSELGAFVIGAFNKHAKHAFKTLGLLGVLQLLDALDPSEPHGGITSVKAHVKQLQANLDALLK